MAFSDRHATFSRRLFKGDLSFAAVLAQIAGSAKGSGLFRFPPNALDPALSSSCKRRSIIDFADVLHSLLAYVFGSYQFHIAEPFVGIRGPLFVPPDGGERFDSDLRCTLRR